VASYLLQKKKYGDIMKFLFDTKNVYSINLQEFLGCSYKQANRIILEIRKIYQLETKYVPATIFQMYLNEDN